MAHISEEELRKNLEQAAALVPVGGVYTHYRTPDHTYTIVGHAILEADDAIGIIYKANYGEGITFVRALTSWQERIDHNGVMVPRFSPVS